MDPRHAATLRSPMPMASHDDSAAAASSRFPPVALTSARLDAFHSAAHTALSHTLKEFMQLDGNGVDAKRWKYMRSRNGVSTYLDRREEADTQNSSLLVAGTLKARMADVMEGLYMDTSEDTRLVQHRIHPRFVDAEVLRVVERRSPEQPFNFTGLKWALLKSSNTGIVSNRDLCFMEKLGTIDIAGGRKLGYFIMQSVELRECPPSMSSKIVRAHLSLCYLFEETSDGLLGVYMTGHLISFGPKLMWKMARNNFADIVISIGRAIKVAHTKRYARLLRAKHEHSGSRAPRSSSGCELCHSPPSFFERYRECMGCHKMNVCKKCRAKREVFRREDHVSLRLASARFCYECMESVRLPAPTTPLVVAAPQHKRHANHVLYHPSYSSSLSSSSQSSLSSSTQSLDDRHGRPARIFQKHSSFSSSDLSTASEVSSYDDYGSYDELMDRDSERSLRMFDLRLREEFEEAGFDEMDELSRRTGLATLGAGESVRDSENDRESGATSTSFTSSSYSGGVDVDLDDEDDVNEFVQSVHLVRRSLQPPEMLEAQKITRDGSVRPQARSLPTPASSTSYEGKQDLRSRLEQASRLAERTHQQTMRRAKTYLQEMTL